MKRNAALMVLGADILTMVALGNAVVGGQQSMTSVGKTGGEHTVASTNQGREGRRLFRKETFGGNGRTCETCHSPSTGTLSPDDVQKRPPGDPLFLHDGLDDGVSGTSRISEHATIRVVRPLPPNIKIAEDPSATSVVFLRGIPTTLNTPALDSALMYDLRARNLSDQALGAIHDHAQNTVEPTEEQCFGSCRRAAAQRHTLFIIDPQLMCSGVAMPHARAAPQKDSEHLSHVLRQ